MSASYAGGEEYGPATALLKEEHDLILRGLTVLERAANRLAEGKPVEPAILLKLVEFFRNFADRCHHGKEEAMLFPALESAGLPREGGPTGVMLCEHEEGRACVRGMAGAAARLAKEPAAAQEVVAHARQFVSLLRAHIHKENDVLFVMADSMLAPEAQRALCDRYGQFTDAEQGCRIQEEPTALILELEGALP
jgi:hemerythrin-like domain-containing protein